MKDAQQRRYLDDVPRDIQDLIYEERDSEVVNLLMERKRLGKMQAALETSRIITRMKQTFPDALPGPSSKVGPRLSPKEKSVLAWIFVSLFVLAGVVFSSVGIYGLVLGLASKGWPSTEARILQSTVELRTTGTGSDRRSAYHALVTYEFTLDGETYQGDRISTADIGRGRSTHARRIVKRYPKGSIATVSYQTGNPSRCLLEPGLRWQAFMMPSVGLFVLLLGIVFLSARISVERDR
ncbi:MAG: DUF3592 domain-containing protein, partial [Verrucomicrobiota bacterium]